MNANFDLKIVTQAYRILGLSHEASLEECRMARNRLIKAFHPDKHPKGWTLDSVRLEDRVYLIQEAYRFIVENYPSIQQLLAPLKDNELSIKTAKSNASHWIYTQIQTFKKNS